MKTVYMLKPISDQCRQWCEDNIDHNYPWSGTIPVEHRYLNDILSGLLDAGFKQGIDFEIVG